MHHQDEPESLDQEEVDKLVFGRLKEKTTFWE